MNKLTLSSFLIVFVCACAMAQVTPASEKGLVERPATPPEFQMKVQFTALDGNGNPIRGVGKDQVTLFDYNQAVKVQDVQDASSLPLDLGIVLLASKDKFDQQQAAAIELVKRVLRPGTDRAFVITAGGEKGWAGSRLTWQGDPNEIAQTIKALDKDAGFSDAFNYELEVTGSGLDRMLIEHYAGSGGVSVFDVCWKMMASDPRPVRRAVVVFRRATRHAPGMQDRVRQDVENNHARVIAISQALGMTIYTIGVEEPNPTSNTMRASMQNSYVPQHYGGDQTTRDTDDKVNRELELQYSGGRSNVNRIAEQTGGMPFWSGKKNYQDAVNGVASAISAPYIVSFTPVSGPNLGQVHPLKVQVSRAAKVAAPQAFVMPQQK